MHRETLFECRFASSRAQRSALIPAWDAGMAESLFRLLLVEDHEDDQGVIEVQAHGRVQRRASFSPHALTPEPAT